VACFSFHFLLILGISSRETLSLLAERQTSLPIVLDKYGEELEKVLAVALGEGLAVTNPLRQGITAYEGAAGIEAGYGFFAPSIPNSYKLVFEIKSPSGQVEYELPRVNDATAGLCLSEILDRIGRIRYDPLREMMIKMLVYSTWQEHPNAASIRAVFGFVEVPTPAEVRLGKNETYRVMYAYDFSFRSQPTEFKGF